MPLRLEPIQRDQLGFGDLQIARLETRKEYRSGMEKNRYLIVGGGMAADAACRGIRDVDASSPIAVVAAESHPPYARPPLSKALWKGADEQSVWLDTETLGVDLHPGRAIVSLDLSARRATDDSGQEYGYERLLLATGATPRRLPDASEDVIYFRTIDDYRRLRGVAQEGAHVVVIGAGFIGSEIAAALTMSGCEVTMVFPGEGIGDRIFPPGLVAFLNDYYRSKGVALLSSEQVERVEKTSDASVVHLDSGRVLSASAVVAGLGVIPNDRLAVLVGLPTDDGILVDDRGRVVGHGDVFAAGDVARFPAAALGRTVRVEHEDHAKSHGRRVGANMAGGNDPYDHLPFFYSDLFELGYEAVGETDPRLTTLEHWVELGRKGIVCYADERSRPRGFLFWDVWGKTEAGAALISAGQPIEHDTLARLLGDS